ncbi:MAG: transporter permease [Pseudonocardiales bacterium]|nr:transporter permease [Jatrophihabitantaceae bacterium]MCW2601941.1 transporter permease [Pseudonocardiales bacterium]
MVGYAVRRVFYGLLIIFLVTLFVFFSVRLVPGDPVRTMLIDVPGITPELIEQRTAQLGLDKPVLTQLLSFLGNAFTGDLGKSFYTEQPVTEMILARLPATLELGAIALALGILIGVPLGMLSALRPNSWVDQLLRVVSVAGISVPSFWIALMLITYLALYLSWTPPLAYSSPFEDPSKNIRQVMLPALALSAGTIASVSRFLRSSLLEVLSSNYIRTVRAKGAGPRIVLLKHATRNSLIPVFTILGLQVGHILGGTVILESIFSIPGMGTLIAEGVRQRDYPVVTGSVIVFATVFIFVTILVDLAYGVIDPRVRYQ